MHTWPLCCNVIHTISRIDLLPIWTFFYGIIHKSNFLAPHLQVCNSFHNNASMWWNRFKKKKKKTPALWAKETIYILNSISHKFCETHTSIDRVRKRVYLRVWVVYFFFFFDWNIRNVSALNSRIKRKYFVLNTHGYFKGFPGEKGERINIVLFIYK